MPVAGSPTKADAWIFDTFLTATRDRHKSGHPFGIGVGTTATMSKPPARSLDGFCVMMVDANGDITVRAIPDRENAGGFNERSEALLPR